MEGKILTVSLTGWSQEMCRGFIITLVKTKGSPCSGRMMEVFGPRNFQQLPLRQADSHSLLGHSIPMAKWLLQGTAVNSV
jgi:hypothetical protein